MATSVRDISGSVSKDVYAALANFTSLRLRDPQSYFLPNGSELCLSSLVGTIPVHVRGSVYNIPITLWLRNDHPATCPIVYVTPTSGMKVSRTSTVDVDGRVDLDYLTHWTAYCEMTILIQIMCAMFSEQCPIQSVRQHLSSEPTSLKKQECSSSLENYSTGSLPVGLALHSEQLKGAPDRSKYDRDLSSGEESMQKLTLASLKQLREFPNVNEEDVTLKKAALNDTESDNEPQKKKQPLSKDEFFPQPPPIPGFLHDQTTPSATHASVLSGGTQAPEVNEDPAIEQLSVQLDQAITVHTVPSAQGASTLSVSRLRATSPLNQPDLNLREFDWEFESDAKTCELCYETMIEPNLLQCCGNGYLCHTCVKQLRKRVMPCPLCQKAGFGTQIDHNYLSVIQNSRVQCPCKQNGCEWKGLFRDAKNHLLECGFREVGCPNKCEDVKIQQQFVSDHLKECQLQSVACQYAEVGCTEPLLRKNIPLHMSHNVHEHLEKIARKNHTVSMKLDTFERAIKDSRERYEESKDKEIRDIEELLSQRKVNILNLEEKVCEVRQQIRSLQQNQEITNATLINLLVRKGEKIELLQHDLAALLNQFRQVPGLLVTTPYAEVPVTFTLNCFSVRKANDEIWLSPPFYTHQGGYKLRLRVYPNGHSDCKGRFASIYLHLVRGEFDEHLQWPMVEFQLQVILKNQRFQIVNLMDKPRSANIRASFNWYDDDSIRYRCRVDGVGLGESYGKHEWVSHSVIGRFLDHDSLSICVHRIIFFPH